MLKQTLKQDRNGASRAPGRVQAWNGGGFVPAFWQPPVVFGDEPYPPLLARLLERALTGIEAIQHRVEPGPLEASFVTDPRWRLVFHWSRY